MSSKEKLSWDKKIPDKSEAKLMHSIEEAGATARSSLIEGSKAARKEISEKITENFSIKYLEEFELSKWEGRDDFKFGNEANTFYHVIGSVDRTPFRLKNKLPLSFYEEKKSAAGHLATLVKAGKINFAGFFGNQHDREKHILAIVNTLNSTPAEDWRKQFNNHPEDDIAGPDGVLNLLLSAQRAFQVVERKSIDIDDPLPSNILKISLQLADDDGDLKEYRFSAVASSAPSGDHVLATPPPASAEEDESAERPVRKEEPRTELKKPAEPKKVEPPEHSQREDDEEEESPPKPHKKEKIKEPPAPPPTPAEKEPENVPPPPPLPEKKETPPPAPEKSDGEDQKTERGYREQLKEYGLPADDVIAFRDNLPELLYLNKLKADFADIKSDFERKTELSDKAALLERLYGRLRKMETVLSRIDGIKFGAEFTAPLISDIGSAAAKIDQETSGTLRKIGIGLGAFFSTDVAKIKQFAPLCKDKLDSIASLLTRLTDVDLKTPTNNSILNDSLEKSGETSTSDGEQTAPKTSEIPREGVPSDYISRVQEYHLPVDEILMLRAELPHLLFLKKEQAKLNETKRNLANIGDKSYDDQAAALNALKQQLQSIGKGAANLKYLKFGKQFTEPLLRDLNDAKRQLDSKLHGTTAWLGRNIFSIFSGSMGAVFKAGDECRAELDKVENIFKSKTDFSLDTKTNNSLINNML